MSVLVHCIVNPHFVVLTIGIRYNCVISKTEIGRGGRQINKRKVVSGKVTVVVEEETGAQKEN